MSQSKGQRAETAADQGASSHRATPLLRRRFFVVAGVTTLLAVAVIGWSMERARHDPEAVVSDYVELIAVGQAEAASDVVDPQRYFDHPEATEAILEPALLTDEVMSAALVPIEDVQVDAGASHLIDDVSVGQTLDVEVTYTLADQRWRVALRVERIADSWFVREEWRLIDPFVAPVVVESTIPSIVEGLIAGFPITTSGLATADFPQRATLMYPGRYEVTSTESAFVRAEPAPVDVIRGHEPIHTTLSFEATPALHDRLAEEIPAVVDECLEAGPDLGWECPSGLRWAQAFGSRVWIETYPEIESITTYGVDNEQENLDPALWMTARGQAGYIDEDGNTRDQSLLLYASITPEEDEVTIEYQPTLGSD